MVIRADTGVELPKETVPGDHPVAPFHAIGALPSASNASPTVDSMLGSKEIGFLLPDPEHEDPYAKYDIDPVLAQPIEDLPIYLQQDVAIDLQEGVPIPIKHLPIYLQQDVAIDLQVDIPIVHLDDGLSLNIYDHLPVGLLDHDDDDPIHLPVGLLDHDDDHIHLPVGLLDHDDDPLNLYDHLPIGLLDADDDVDDGFTVVRSRRFRRVRGLQSNPPYTAPPDRVCENAVPWGPKAGPLRKVKQWAAARRSGIIGTPDGPGFFTYGSYGASSLEYY